jgi:transposase
VNTASVPERIVEKGLVSDRVVVNALVAKYSDHLPLYQQILILEREAAILISRATMDGWVMRCGELLMPVAVAIGRELLAGSYIQTDETPVPVQMHDGRGKNHQAYLWQYGPARRECDVRLPNGTRSRGSAEIPQQIRRYFTDRRLRGI